MASSSSAQQSHSSPYRPRKRATPMAVDEMVEMVGILQKRDYDCSRHQYARPNARKDRIMQEVVEVLLNKFGQERTKDQLRKRWSDLKKREPQQMGYIQKVLKRRHQKSSHKRRHHRHHRRHHRQQQEDEGDRSGASPPTSAADAPQPDMPPEDLVVVEELQEDSPQHTPPQSPIPPQETINISSPHTPAARSSPGQRSPPAEAVVCSDVEEAASSPRLAMTASTRGRLQNEIAMVRLHYERARQKMVEAKLKYSEAERELAAGENRLKDVVDILGRF